MPGGGEPPAELVGDRRDAQQLGDRAALGRRSAAVGASRSGGRRFRTSVIASASSGRPLRSRADAVSRATGDAVRAGRTSCHDGRRRGLRRAPPCDAVPPGGPGRRRVVRRTAGARGDRRAAASPIRRLAPATSRPPALPATGRRAAERAGRGNSAVMAIGSLVSRGTGFVRTAAIARGDRRVAVGNAYTTAQILPGMVYELLLGGVLASVVVPLLVRAPQGTTRTAAQAYAQRLLTLAVIVLGVATVLAVLARARCSPLLLRAARRAPRRPGPDHHAVVPAAADRSSSTAWPRSSARCSTPAATSPRRCGRRSSTTSWSSRRPAALHRDLGAEPGRRRTHMTPGQIAAARRRHPARHRRPGGRPVAGAAPGRLPLAVAVRLPRARACGELARVGGWMFCYVVVSQVGAARRCCNLLNRAAGDDAPAR